MPVELGTLAGPRLTPRKETTIHDRHEEAGAAFMWAADWRRPHHYSTPEAEVDTVRNRVGVIDVSTLGKFRMRGPEAATLLERLYPNRFADLPVGRIRYGAMLDDEGVVLDDGTVVRVADDEFFVTVTTGNTAALERWITWWNADWQLDARVLNVTGAFAALNVAGPRARDVMQDLTTADISADAFPYMAGARVDVAGVPSLVLRIGFVGELSYEIHIPSMYGEHVWDAVMEAGDRARHRAVRARGSAHPAAREAAHPHRAGHRRRVRPLRGRPGLDGEGRQAGLPGEAIPRGPRPLRVPTSDWSASRRPPTGCRRREPPWSATGPGSGA